MRETNDNRGVTLVELIIAVTIVVILATVLNFTFQGWMGRYNVESQIRQIYGDMMEARVEALQRKRVYFVRFPTATSYEIYEDDNPGPDGNGTLETAADRRLAGFPKTVAYPLIWAGGNITFDSRGMGTVQKPPNITLQVNTTVVADYDCLRLSPLVSPLGIYSSFSLGKWDGSACVIK